MANSSVPVSSPAAARTPYLPAFTGLRAGAAYLVFLHHFNPFQGSVQLVALSALVSEFHIGVPVFFVLSGFLITLRYATHDLTQPRQWLRYMRNRFARVYPIYLLLTLLTYAAFWRQGTFVLRDFLLSLTLTQTFFDTAKYAGVAQAWSLTVEECFYLLAPAAFWLLRRQPRSLWWQPFVLLAVGSVLVVVFTPHYVHFSGFFGSFRFMLLFTFLGRCMEFYAGMQLAHWYRKGRLRRYRLPGLLTGLGLAVIGAVTCGMVLIKGGYTYGQEHPFGIALNNVALPGGIMLLFAGLLTEQTWLRWLLSTRLLQVLGKSSYVFYLIHLGVLHDFLAARLTSNSALLFVLLNALAIGIHLGVEEPLNRWLRPAISPLT